MRGPENSAITAVDSAAGHVVYLKGKACTSFRLRWSRADSPRAEPTPSAIDRAGRRRQPTDASPAGKTLRSKTDQACDCHGRAGRGRYRIEAVGIQGTFDLAWDIPVAVPQTRTVFDVFSRIHVGDGRGPCELKVLQTIESKQGNVASVRVRIPSGFPTISGQQLNVTEAKTYTVGVLRFRRLYQGRSETGRNGARWSSLGAGTNPPNSAFALSGFEVEGAAFGARRSTGRAIRGIPLRLSRRKQRSAN